MTKYSSDFAKQDSEAGFGRAKLDLAHKATANCFGQMADGDI